MVFCADSVGGMFGLYFSETPPNNYAEMMAGDRARFNVFFHAMLDEGVYFAPAAFEAGFVSAQHSDEVIDETIAAARRVFPKTATHLKPWGQTPLGSYIFKIVYVVV